MQADTRPGQMDTQETGKAACLGKDMTFRCEQAPSSLIHLPEKSGAGSTREREALARQEGGPRFWVSASQRSGAGTRLSAPPSTTTWGAGVKPLPSCRHYQRLTLEDVTEESKVPVFLKNGKT